MHHRQRQRRARRETHYGGQVRHAIDDHFRKAVANEIGNRLRCGIYDGTSIDKLFESVWKPELDKAIQDRIQDRVDKTIDTVIAKRLKQLWPG